MTRAVWLALGALGLLYAWILWGVELPPLQDLPAHMEVAFLHARVRDGVAPYAAWFRIEAQPWPNSLWIIVMSLLGDLFGALAAAKIVGTIALVAWPLAIGWCAAQAGRSPWLALLAMPAALDITWNVGLFNWVATRPLFFVALGLAFAHARAGTLRTGLQLTAVLCLTFLGHATLWGFTCLAVLVVIAASGKLARLWPLAAGAPIAAPFAWAMLRGPRYGGLEWHEPDYAFRKLWEHLGWINPGVGEEIAYGLCALAWLAVVALAARRDGLREGRALFATVLVLALLLFFGPLHLPGQGIAVIRLEALLWALVILLPAAEVSSRAWRASLSALALAAALAHVGGVHWHYVQFNRRDMGDFTEMLSTLPPGKKLATYYVDPFSPFVTNSKALWHWAKLYAIEGNGFTENSFAWLPGLAYVTLTEEGRRAGQGHAPVYTEQGLAGWDYLLVRSRDDAPDRQFPYARLVGATGTWRLYDLHP